MERVQLEVAEEELSDDDEGDDGVGEDIAMSANSGRTVVARVVGEAAQRSRGGAGPRKATARALFFWLVSASNNCEKKFYNNQLLAR